MIETFSWFVNRRPWVCHSTRMSGASLNLILHRERPRLIVSEQSWSCWADFIRTTEFIIRVWQCLPSSFFLSYSSATWLKYWEEKKSGTTNKPKKSESLLWQRNCGETVRSEALFKIHEKKETNIFLLSFFLRLGVVWSLSHPFFIPCYSWEYQSKDRSKWVWRREEVCVCASVKCESASEKEQEREYSFSEIFIFGNIYHQHCFHVYKSRSLKRSKKLIV